VIQNNIALFLLLLLSMSGFAQGERQIRFKVVAQDSTSVSDINVVNMVNEKSAKTNMLGEFTIAAKENDLLFLQKENFEYKRYLIEAEDLKKNVVIIHMVARPLALKEVVVTKKARTDDLIKKHKDHKKFTPAERKLYAARTGPVDILVNALTGRTKMLRKELNVEMSERLLARLEPLFEDKYYVDHIKIPEEYIGDFQHFLIEDDEFESALRAKNKTLMRFLMSKLAVSYNGLMTEEFEK
jgi:hypothetical protein